MLQDHVVFASVSRSVYVFQLFLLFSCACLAFDLFTFVSARFRKIRGNRKTIHMVFSGDMERKKEDGSFDTRTEAGVAIVIRNNLEKYLLDIDPTNDRLMAATFKGILANAFVDTFFYQGTNLTKH